MRVARKMRQQGKPKPGDKCQTFCEINHTLQSMTTRERYVSAAALSAVVFTLYLVTLAPSSAMWDAGEYIAAAKSLGIPHQPGNPLFVLIAHVAGLLPISPSYAVRINMLAAFSSAAAAGFWFLCAEHVLRETIAGKARRVAAAATAALLGA